MKINVYTSYNEMSTATADFIADEIKNKPNSFLCIPSGDTPTGTLSKLVEYEGKGFVDFSKCKFVALDEWVGMDKHDIGSCQHYVYSQFFDRIPISKDNVVMFNAKASEQNAECKRVDDFIFTHGPLDIVLVGVGGNGHIGLNEPGVSPELYCHVIALEQTTIQGAEKYFSDQKALDKGITLGLKHIMNAKTVIVIANGEKKAEIIKKIIEGDVTESIPGSILQRHSNCYFFLDREAASRLKVI